MPIVSKCKAPARITTYRWLNHRVLDASIRQAGYTNEAVAEALGLSEEYIRKLRKKDTNVHIKLLSQLMQLFHLTYEELTISYTEEPAE